jgi:hypothetical protein
MKTALLKNFMFVFLIIFTASIAASQNKNIIAPDEIGYKEAVKTLNNIFSWAVKKDFNLFFYSIANDSGFISVTPYKRVKFGFREVLSDTAFWGDPNFKAIRHEIRNLKINFSNSGTVAWFYCELDDINEWKGKPANWLNTRWTGVLEKRDGIWKIVMQHFSFPKDN